MPRRGKSLVEKYWIKIMVPQRGYPLKYKHLAGSPAGASYQKTQPFFLQGFGLAEAVTK
jgi:hypothetical protein